MRGRRRRRTEPPARGKPTRTDVGLCFGGYDGGVEFRHFDPQHLDRLQGIEGRSFASLGAEFDGPKDDVVWVSAVVCISES